MVRNDERNKMLKGTMIVFTTLMHCKFLPLEEENENKHTTVSNTAERIYIKKS